MMFCCAGKKNNRLKGETSYRSNFLLKCKKQLVGYMHNAVINYKTTRDILEVIIVGWIVIKEKQFG